MSEMSGPWVPMERADTLNPELVERAAALGVPMDGAEAWSNHMYQAIVRTMPALVEGDPPITWLSIKRHDRRAIRSWRHLQQIKNEVCGPLREGVEIFPAEDRLVDGANECHLWVLPEDVRIPFGFTAGLVSTDEDVERFNEGREQGLHQGRQDAWQEGLTTGRNEHTKFVEPDQREKLRKQGM